MASMARKPKAPATPAPTTAVGYDAPPVDTPVVGVCEFAPPVEPSVADETLLMTVALPGPVVPLIEALTTLPLERGAALENGVVAVSGAVVETTAEAGYSLGR